MSMQVHGGPGDGSVQDSAGAGGPQELAVDFDKQCIEMLEGPEFSAESWTGGNLGTGSYGGSASAVGDAYGAEATSSLGNAIDTGKRKAGKFMIGLSLIAPLAGAAIGAYFGVNMVAGKELYMGLVMGTGYGAIGGCVASLGLSAAGGALRASGGGEALSQSEKDDRKTAMKVGFVPFAAVLLPVAICWGVRSLANMPNSGGNDRT